MAKSRSWHARLIGILLSATCAFAVAALPTLLGSGSPTHAQTPKLSDTDKADLKERQKNNEDKIKKLKSKQRKLQEEMDELESLKPGAKLVEKQKLENKFEEKFQEYHKLNKEIILRGTSKNNFAEHFSAVEKSIANLKNRRADARKQIEGIYCRKDNSAAWKADLKDAVEEHKGINKKYFEARRKLKFLEEVSTERFGLGGMERFRTAQRKEVEEAEKDAKSAEKDTKKAEKDTKKAEKEEEFTEEEMEEFRRNMLRELRRKYKLSRVLIPGKNIAPDDLAYFDFDPKNCPPDSAIHASQFPVEPKTINIAVQLPEVCVGTTYILTEETIFEEDLPVVTEDEEDPRDTPQSDVPVASVPQESPGDTEEPRDVPREETPGEGVPISGIPVTLTPEDSDEPRDTPKEDVPVVSTPEDSDEPRDVPVVSIPEDGDEPRDVPDEEIDLGLVKAVTEVVALAVTDVQTGEPVTDVAIKLLPAEPPLPGSEMAEATPDGGETFDEASFFEDDAEGGFTGEDGEFELTLPVGDYLPRRPGDTYPLRASAEIDKELSEWRKKYIDASKKREEIIGDMYESNPDFKKAIDKIDASHDRVLTASKAEAAKQHKAIDKRKNLGPEAKKRLHRQTDNHLALQEGRLAEIRERERNSAAEDYWFEEPPDVQEALEASIKTVKEAQSKIADLEREMIDSKIREAELREAKEKKKAEQKTPGPVESGDQSPKNGQLANADTFGARRLHLAVDTEPHEQHVVGLPGPAPEGEALELAMSNAVLAPFVVSAFSVGTQPVAVLSVPKSEIGVVKEQLRTSNSVSWFEPDPCWSKQEIDDPYFSSKGLWGQDYDDQWAIKRSGFSEEMLSAARDNADAKPVTVAVIDTGIDWYHPDLDQKTLWRNEGEIPDNGIDDDGNGYVDDVIGWNFIDENNKPWDYDGHGTFIAGVIGAASGNGTGIAGVNPHARLMALKALDPFGQGYASMVAEAMMYAADNGAKIINISLGGKGISRVVDLAIAHAVSKGALVVVAAGNEATDVSGFGPAGSEGVLTVSATDQRDRRAGFSNWGEEVDISAPGVDVMSLRARNTDLLAVIRGVEYKKAEGIIGDSRAYYRASGTSFAAPIVSGAASLIMSLNPDLDTAAVRRMLLNSARDIEVPGVDNYAGYGLLDVDAALKADPAFNIESRIAVAKPVRIDGKSVLRLVGTANADAFDEASISLGKGKEPSKWLTIKQRITSPVQDGVLMDIPAAALSGSKAWTIRLITKHKNGTERESRFAVTLG